MIRPARATYGAFGIYDAAARCARGHPRSGIGGDGTQPRSGLVLRRRWWCAGKLIRNSRAWTAGERIEEAEVTGADAIVTACPGCEQNFIDAVAADGTKMKVFDVLELVAQAL